MWKNLTIKSLTINSKLLLILSLFFLVRIIYSYIWGWMDPNLGDGITYNNYALAILNQSDWLTNPIFHGNNREPVYPIFLALIYTIFGTQNLFAVYFFQSVIGVLTIYYIFKLSSSVFDEKKSYLSLFWAGFYVFYIMYTGKILRESLLLFLIIFSFYHLWIFLDKDKKPGFIRDINLWKFIIAFTILLHADARFLFYIPFISILFIIYKNFWIGIKQYLSVLVIVILLLIPWTIRNYIAYGGFVLINTMTLDARQENVSIRFNLLDTRKITHPYSDGLHFLSFNKNYPSEEERQLIKEGKNPNNRPDYEIDLIKKDVYPASTFLGRKLYNVISMWSPVRFWWDYRPFPDAGLNRPWSLRHNLISIFLYGTLLPFVFFGLFYLFRKRHKAAWFLIFPIVVHFLLHFLTFGEERYRHYIEPFTIIIACYSIVVVKELIKEKIVGHNGERNA